MSKQYFPATAPVVALDERGKAIACLRREMDQIHRAPYAHFLTIMLLALMQIADSDPKDYGRQHLSSARALINRMLRDVSMSTTTNESVFRLCLGLYLYWDMCSSFLVEPAEPEGLNSFDISLAVLRMGDWHHPMYATCSRLLLIIANVGRYCRQVYDMPQSRNHVQEAMLEALLSTWTADSPDSDLRHLYEAFRNHGLVFLHQSRAHAQRRCPMNPSVTEEQGSLILRYAEATVRHLLRIPASSYTLNFQSLSLLIAGSELTKSDHILRDEVRGRLRVIYSFNRLPANLMALQFLEELWDARDSGNPSFWLSYMMQKDWRLLLV